MADTKNHLSEGDLVAYDHTEYPIGAGEPTTRRRAAVIDVWLSPELVGVAFTDVNPESGGGYDYDSPARYTKIDRDEWTRLTEAENARTQAFWDRENAAAAERARRHREGV